MVLDMETRWHQLTGLQQNKAHGEAKTGFQIDACISISDWLIFVKRWFDWLGAPTSQHQFENPTKF